MDSSSARDPTALAYKEPFGMFDPRDDGAHGSSSGNSDDETAETLEWCDRRAVEIREEDLGSHPKPEVRVPAHWDSLDAAEMRKLYEEEQMEKNNLLQRLHKRLDILGIVKAAYLRDVVTMKHVMNNVLKSEERQEVLEEWKHTIPSLNLTKGLDMFAPTSAHLQLKPCEKCGGHLEVQYHDIARAEILERKIDKMKEKLRQSEIKELQANELYTKLELQFSTLIKKNELEKKTMLKELSEMRQRIDNDAEIKEQLDKANKSHKKENWELIATNKQLEHDMEDHQQLLSDLEHLRNSMETMRRDMDALEQKVEKSNGELAVRESRIVELLLEKKVMEEQAEEAKRHIKELEEDTVNAIRDMKRAVAIKEIEEKKYYELSCEVAPLKDEISKLKNQIEVEHDATDELIEKIKRESKDLSVENNKLVASNREKNKQLKEQKKLLEEKDEELEVMTANVFLHEQRLKNKPKTPQNDGFHDPYAALDAANAAANAALDGPPGMLKRQPSGLGHVIDAAIVKARTNSFISIDHIAKNDPSYVEAEHAVNDNLAGMIADLMKSLGQKPPSEGEVADDDPEALQTKIGTAMATMLERHDSLRRMQLDVVNQKKLGRSSSQRNLGSGGSDKGNLGSLSGFTAIEEHFNEDDDDHHLEQEVADVVADQNLPSPMANAAIAQVAAGAAARLGGFGGGSRAPKPRAPGSTAGAKSGSGGGPRTGSGGGPRGPAPTPIAGATAGGGNYSAAMKPASPPKREKRNLFEKRRNAAPNVPVVESKNPVDYQESEPVPGDGIAVPVDPPPPVIDTEADPKPNASVAAEPSLQPHGYKPPDTLGEAKVLSARQNASEEEKAMRDAILCTLTSTLGPIHAKKAFNALVPVISLYAGLLSGAMEGMWDSILMNRQAADFYCKLSAIFERIVRCSHGESKSSDIHQTCQDCVPLALSTTGGAGIPGITPWVSVVNISPGFVRDISAFQSHLTGRMVTKKYSDYFGSDEDFFVPKMDMARDSLVKIHNYTTDALQHLNGYMVTVLKEWSEAKAVFVDIDNIMEKERKATQLKADEAYNKIIEELSNTFAMLEASKEMVKTTTEKVEVLTAEVTVLRPLQGKLMTAEDKIKDLLNKIQASSKEKDDHLAKHEEVVRHSEFLDRRIEDLTSKLKEKNLSEKDCRREISELEEKQSALVAEMEGIRAELKDMQDKEYRRIHSLVHVSIQTQPATTETAIQTEFVCPPMSLRTAAKVTNGAKVTQFPMVFSSTFTDAATAVAPNTLSPLRSPAGASLDFLSPPGGHMDGDNYSVGSAGSMSNASMSSSSKSLVPAHRLLNSFNNHTLEKARKAPSGGLLGHELGNSTTSTKQLISKLEDTMAQRKGPFPTQSPQMDPLRSSSATVTSSSPSSSGVSVTSTSASKKSKSHRKTKNMVLPTIPGSPPPFHGITDDINSRAATPLAGSPRIHDEDDIRSMDSSMSSLTTTTTAGAGVGGRHVQHASYPAIGGMEVLRKMGSGELVGSGQKANFTIVGKKNGVNVVSSTTTANTMHSGRELYGVFRSDENEAYDMIQQSMLGVDPSGGSDDESSCIGSMLSGANEKLKEFDSEGKKVANLAYLSNFIATQDQLRNSNDDRPPVTHGPHKVPLEASIGMFRIGSTARKNAAATRESNNAAALNMHVAASGNAFGGRVGTANSSSSRINTGRQSSMSDATPRQNGGGRNKTIPPVHVPTAVGMDGQSRK